MIGYNPCGFAVDMLRSCYSTSAQLLRYLPRVSPIEWYWAEDDAPFLPFPSAVNSLNWVDRRDWADGAGLVGEVPTARRPWRDGSPPAGYLGPGDAPWGTANDFLYGGRLTLIPPVLRSDGLPACCGQCNGFSVTPEYVDVTVSGFTNDPLNDWSVFNGTWRLAANPDNFDLCAWAFVLDPTHVIGFQFVSGSFFFDVAIGSGVGIPEIAYQATPSIPYGRDPLTLPVIPGNPYNAYGPAEVTVSFADLCDSLDVDQPILTDAGAPIQTDTGDALLTSP